MPCYDPRDDEEAQKFHEAAALKVYKKWEQEYNKRTFAEAALCAVFSILDSETLFGPIQSIYNNRLIATLKHIDEKEAGIKIADIKGWWEIHKKADQKRKNVEKKVREIQVMREKERQDDVKTRKAALAKLSPKERKALGIKDE